VQAQEHDEAPRPSGAGASGPRTESESVPSAPAVPAASPALERGEFLVRLAAGLAHEIKNPLSTMAINLALLEEEWGRAAGQRDPAAPEPTAREKRCQKRVLTLQREVRRLETILEDFLRFARGGQVNRSAQDLALLVKEVLDFVEPEDRLQAIRHHVELPAGLPLVMLDPGAFKQAVLNLCVNARQAMPEGGELIVRARREGNYVELSITDTGVGMQPMELERCFELYWSTKRSGTGLGLSTTRRIVEEHGGTITVVSEVGRGTSFSIVLPLLVEIHSSRKNVSESEAARSSEDVRDGPTWADGRHA
jgi:signal transduction histidine kinase